MSDGIVLTLKKILSDQVKLLRVSKLISSFKKIIYLGAIIHFEMHSSRIYLKLCFSILCILIQETAFEIALICLDILLI